MVFFGKKSVVLNPIVLDGVTLDKVDSTKFLGVLIDGRLTWSNHIDVFRRKASNVIGSMYRLRKTVNNNNLLKIYNALILPHLTYCCKIWGNTYSVD